MVFKFSKTELEWAYVISPQVFGDERWFFMETYNQKDFQNNWIPNIFIQDNHSKSHKWVFRWFHFQTQNIQAKLIRVTKWSILDFVIDLRKKSPTYKEYIMEFLSAENKKQLFIPKWFAHWFLTLEDWTEFIYKCDDLYNPKAEWGIIYNDAKININREELMKEYSIKELIISEKDKKNLTLEEFYKINPF